MRQQGTVQHERPLASNLIALGLLGTLSMILFLSPQATSGEPIPCRQRDPSDIPSIAIMRRSVATGMDQKSIMHNHMSRKVFERACKASKDSIDEIIACLTSNESMIKAIKPELAAECYKTAFGSEFNPKDVVKHKEMICNNRDKFEQMTACVYKKTAETVSTKELEKFTEAMVDVGLCIINALDG